MPTHESVMRINEITYIKCAVLKIICFQLMVVIIQKPKDNKLELIHKVRARIEASIILVSYPHVSHYQGAYSR